MVMLLFHLRLKSNRHIHQICRSFLETHLRIHRQAEIPFHSQSCWKRIWEGRKSYFIVFLPNCTILAPDPQVVLSGLHESRDIALISTESSHQKWVMWFAISNLNVIRWCPLAIYIHGEEGDVDIASIGLRDEVDTASQFWIGIWVWGRGQNPTGIWVGSSTCCEQLQGTVLNLKSWSISIRVWVESEINLMKGVYLRWCHNFFITSSTVGSGLTG